jgi:DnaK suppressor protein
MADDVIEITRVRTNDRARTTRSLLTAELDRIAARLHTEAEVPKAGVAGGDFLDVAQGIEHQELARLSASRLMERARRLRLALARVSEGEYGLCTECGAAIPPERLLAVPDAATCVACQSRLERIAAAGRAGRHDAEDVGEMSA